MPADINLFEKFRAAHDDFVLIPNAWDQLTALTLKAVGFTAVATTSVGVNAGKRYSSNAQMPLDFMISVLRDICDVTDIAMTADMESGYSSTREGVATMTRKLLDAGVGLNLKDSNCVPDRTQLSLYFGIAV